MIHEQMQNRTASSQWLGACVHASMHPPCSERQLSDNAMCLASAQNIFAMSAAYSSYMAVSSNLRYQVSPLRPYWACMEPCNLLTDKRALPQTPGCLHSPLAQSRAAVMIATPVCARPRSCHACVAETTLEPPVSGCAQPQIIAGVVEERGIEAVFAKNAALCSALSFVVRTSNTFLGSLMWVDYIRLLGLQ